MRQYRTFEVFFMPPTNTKSSRVKIIDKKNKTRIIINWIDKCYDTSEVAETYLKEKGFNIIGYGDMDTHYVIFCDNWGEDFINLV